MQVKRKVINGKWFIDLRSGHAKDEIAYAQLLSTIILQELCLGQVMENKQKDSICHCFQRFI
jgi:hypothetical protein